MDEHCKTNIKLLIENSSKKCKIDCNNYMKNITPVTIPRTKIKFFNKRKKDINWYLNEGKLKNILFKGTRPKKCIEKWDYMSTLPRPLYERVANIIPNVPEENEYIFESNMTDITKQDRIQKVVRERNVGHIEPEKSFNESTCSLILKMQQKFEEMTLKIEDTPNARERKRNSNWFTQYICEPKEKRVKWQSKLYKLEKDISEKPTDEQAEEMMDAVAERFSNWINSYGTSDTNIPKEYIRALFNIDSGAKLLSGLKINPRVIKSVPHNVAKIWGMPQMSMKNKFLKKIEERRSRISHIIIKHAFSRTIPPYERPWMPLRPDITIEPYCPEELLTYSQIFDGITHLRSTKEFINFLKKTPNVERPKHLVEQGLLIEKSQINDKIENDFIPLYELFDKAQKSYEI